MVFSYVAQGAENFHLNAKLDYTSDSQDGPLITGDHMEDGVVAGKPNYVIIYGEGCFNSKHQARRTVELYQKYRGARELRGHRSGPAPIFLAAVSGEEILQRLHPPRGGSGCCRHCALQSVGGK
jgi:hypothetical protein